MNLAHCRVLWPWKVDYWFGYVVEVVGEDVERDVRYDLCNSGIVKAGSAQRGHVLIVLLGLGCRLTDQQNALLHRSSSRWLCRDDYRVSVLA